MLIIFSITPPLNLDGEWHKTTRDDRHTHSYQLLNCTKTLIL